MSPLKSFVKRRLDLVICLAFFVLALSVRVVAIDWGLPNQNYEHSRFAEDEPNVVLTSLALGKGVYILGIVRNQPVFYFAGLGYFMGYYLVGLVGGRFADWPDFWLQVDQNLSQFILAGRFFVLAISALTVVATYLVARRLFSRRVGVLAGAFLLLSFGHVVFATFYRLDVLMPLLFLLSLYAIMRLPEAPSGQLRPYVVAAVLVGLTVATKVTGAALLVPLLLVPFARLDWSGMVPLGRPRIDRRYPYALTVTLASYFALAGPSYLMPRIDNSGEEQLAAAEIASGMARRLDRSGQTGYLVGLSPFRWSLPYHLLDTLPNQLGVVIYLLGFLGLALMAIQQRYRRQALFLGVALLAFLLPIGYLNRATWRDMLPVLPVFAILAGFGLDRLMNLAGGRWPSLRRSRLSRVVMVTALVLTLAGPAAHIVQHHRLLLGTDTRDLARVWVEQNVAPGSHLAIETYGPAVLDSLGAESWPAVAGWLNDGDWPASRPSYQVSILERHLAARKDWLEPQWLLPFLAQEQVDYVIVSSAYYGRFYNEAVELHFPEVVKPGRAVHDLIASNLELVAQFTPQRPDRPGPLIRIYRVPGDLAGRWQVASGRFEPFAGMDRPESAVGYYQFVPR